MVKYENGKIVVGFLDDSKVLSKSMIDMYDYKTIKNDFDYLVELLEMNKLWYSILRGKLEYSVTDDLEFKIGIDSSIKCYTLDSCTNGPSDTDNSILTMDVEDYKKYFELCEELLIKVKNSWQYLNEVERFIIKSLEFDVPSFTDEELQEELMYCNKKYYQFKKSGFIKLGMQLQLDRAKRNNGIIERK